jgi:hypothetical protein
MRSDKTGRHGKPVRNANDVVRPRGDPQGLVGPTCRKLAPDGQLRENSPANNHSHAAHNKRNSGLGPVQGRLFSELIRYVKFMYHCGKSA